MMRLRQCAGGDRSGWRTRELDGNLALDLHQRGAESSMERVQTCEMWVSDNS